MSNLAAGRVIQAIQDTWRGLPFGRGSRDACVSHLFGKQVIFKTRRSPVTMTLTADDCGLVKRTIWQCFEDEPASQTTLDPFQFAMHKIRKILNYV